MHCALYWEHSQRRSGKLVEYTTGQMMRVGDRVLADGMSGVIVCDFDNRQFLDGYESWDTPTVEMLGGGTLSSGVLVETVEAGLVYYEDGTWGIEYVPSLQP